MYEKVRTYKIKSILIATSKDHIDEIIEKCLKESQEMGNKLKEQGIEVVIGQCKVYDSL